MPTTDHERYFKFEVDGWRKELDENLRDKLKLLVKSYLQILSLDRKMRYIKNFMRQTKFNGHVINILKLQYDDLHQKLPCGVEITDALNQIYAELYGHFENASSVKKSLEALKIKNWHLTCADDRPKVAAKILSLRDTEKLPPAFNLLFNFRCNGFMIFYFVLKELQTQLFEDSNFLNQNDSSDDFKENPYYEELYRVYSDSIAAKKTKSIWNKALIEICRRHLKKIFEDSETDPMTIALKYFWAQRSCDSGRNFFWNVFTEQEIFNSIYTEEAIKI